MQKLLAYWKKDFINKLIVLIAAALILGVAGIALLLFFLMPQGKSANGVISAYFPTETLMPAVRLTRNAAEAKATSIAATASVPPSPTTIPFTPYVPSLTPTLTNTPGPVTPTLEIPTDTPSGPTASPTISVPTTTPTLIPPAPSATRVLPTSAHPTATRLPTATSSPYPPGFTPSPTAEAPNGLACLPGNPPQTGKVLSVIDGDTVKVLINGFTYNVRYIGVQLPANKHYALLASVTNNRLAFAKTVTLISDSVDKDASGYLLRYMLVGDTMPAYEMLKQGVLATADIPAGFACAQTFQAAQQAAQNQQVGIWVPTPTVP